ncbi:MAG TPA: flagellar export chaperone FliS [Steroidobacteraceae bacterium]|nr:flagellar export chaperone FliS [Steroidobacteraceae bacterium]
MAASPYAAKIAAYSSASAHGGVAAADPHKLTLMLMDGALERIATARGCIERNETSEKAKLLNRAVSIIGELRNSLDMSKGGAIATNLGELYDYMCRQLLKANVENKAQPLEHVTTLLRDIRDAWASIPADARARPAG